MLGASLVACATLFGSQTFVRTQGYPGAADHAVRVLAIAPFQLGSRLIGGEAETPDVTPAALVARDLAEALAARGVGVVPPEDMQLALGLSDAALVTLDPVSTAAVAHAQFGADAVLLGVTTRFREREGEALGSRRPASVRFEVVVHSAPAGEKLWSAAFDETQLALSANVLRTRHYPGGGTRWLSADELARWGAERVASAYPFSP